MTVPRIPAERAVHTEYGAHLEPELRVAAGESFVVETKDFFHDLVEDEDAIGSVIHHPRLAASQCVRSNPVAGPVYVDGVRAGDTLCVEIESIDVRDHGWTITYPGSGIVDGLVGWEEVHGATATRLEHEPGPSGTLRDGEVVMRLKREHRWPLAPFIGTIVTAPERGSENTVLGQGPWGGNLDCREIAPGATVYLNAAHDGGLLFLGDIHASQGDGELTGTADETAGHVRMRCTALPERSVPGVCRIETATDLIQLDSARNAGTLERAIDSCYLHLMGWLTDDYGMSRREAYLHMTANSLVRASIFQACDGLYTCGVSFPKSCL